MADIIIKVDLDSPEYKQSLQKIVVESEKAGDKAGKALDEGISDVLNKSVSRSVDNTTSSIKRLVSTISDISGKLALAAPVIIFLERRFGVFTDIFATFGLNLAEITKKIISLADTFALFLSGGAGLNDLKIGVGLLLQELGILDKVSLEVIDKFRKFTDLLPQIAGIGAALGLIAKPLVIVGKNIKELTKFSAGLASIFFNPRGVFSTTVALGALSASFGALGASLADSENNIVKYTGKLSLLASVITGSVAGAISFLIIELGQLANKLGTQLVGFFDAQAQAFNKVEQSQQVFRATVDSVNRSIEGTIGTYKTWESVTKLVADRFNLTRDSVRKSAQEILLVSQNLGLAESQMRKLLIASAEYAKINKKDVFDVTVAFVNALNGNSQAVASLGVKLSEASLQQFAYSNGITKSISKLSENEKVQLRFNKVMKQYSEVAGIGAIAAGTLADQQLRLENNIKQVNASLGEGARIIESNNILAFAYNQVLNRLNQTTFKVIGFFGALGARILQVGGLVLEFSFKIFALVKIYKILQALFESGVGIKTFQARLPFINQSLNEIISSITGTTTKVTSLSGAFKAASSIIKKSVEDFSQTIFRTNIKNILSFQALKGALTSVRIAAIATYRALIPLLLPFAKIAAIVAVVVGALFGIFKVFQELEERTKVFTDLYRILVDEFSSSASIFSPILEFFKGIGRAITNIANKVFGLFVAGLAGVVSAITALAKRNPFNVFSQQTIVKLSGLEKRLDVFRGRLSQVGFDMRKLGEDGSRSIAGLASSTVNLERIAQTVEDLKERYRDFGKTASQVLIDQRNRELEDLNAFIAIQQAKGNSITQFELLRSQLLQDYNEKVRIANEETLLNSEATFSGMAEAFIIQAKRMKTTAGELAKTMTNLAVNGFGRTFQMVGRALAEGKNGFDAFKDGVKQILGEIASAIGDLIIKWGIANIASQNYAVGGAQLVAGAALKTLAGSLGSSGGGGGAGAGSVSSGGGINVGDGGLATPQTSLISDESERAEAQSSLVVNVNGDVFDSEETGNRLVGIINDTFGKKGVALTDFRTA